MSTSKVLLGLLAGAAAGVVLGVLFAPEKGSVTRTKLAQAGEDYAETVKEKFNEFIDTVNEKFDTAKEDMGKGKQKAEV